MSSTSMTTLSPLLVDAKKEYTAQLADLLTPYVMNTVARIYENSKKKTAAQGLKGKLTAINEEKVLEGDRSPKHM